MSLRIAMLNECHMLTERRNKGKRERQDNRREESLGLGRERRKDEKSKKKHQQIWQQSQSAANTQTHSFTTMSISLYHSCPSASSYTKRA